MKRLFIGLLALAMALLTGGGAAQAAGSGGGTQHFGPFAGDSTDGGSCGNFWANDTFNRVFSVHDNGDGTFRVTEEFKDGTFVTIGGPSPGGCETTSDHHGSTVAPGIVGSLRGYLSGTVASSTFNAAGCTAGDCTTTAGFILAVFGPAARFTCFVGPGDCDFNFEYDSSDQSLAYRHWQDKSSPSGEQFIGDIATA